MTHLKTDIELYDKALYKYLYPVSQGKLVYAPTDRAFYTFVKRNPEYKDKIPFPLVSYYRDPNIPIDMNRYSNQAIKGTFTKLTTVDTDSKERDATYIHSLPVTLSYTVDMWSSKAEDVLEISQQLLIKLTIKNPVLIVPINPDGEDGRFHILDVNLVDNSDIENEENTGRLYRHTFSFNINAWIKNVEVIRNGAWSCPEIVVTDDLSIYD
jgi:hypothetical protein